MKKKKKQVKKSHQSRRVEKLKSEQKGAKLGGRYQMLH